MAGYYGYSMSNNAVNAYANGEKPYSKWAKAAILWEVCKLIVNGDLPEEIADGIDKLKLSELRSFLKESSWHHTSKHYNRTQFYCVDEYRILEYFGYVETICVERTNGETVYGEYCGDRHPVTGRLQEFRTTTGETFPSSEIVNAKIAYVKGDKS